MVSLLIDTEHQSESPSAGWAAVHGAVDEVQPAGEDPTDWQVAVTRHLVETGLEHPVVEIDLLEIAVPLAVEQTVMWIRQSPIVHEG